jgi:hypothetical protein
MAVYELRDFDDIIDMVMEELKYQSSDETSINRIKRDINAIYLDEVVPFKRWNWLSGHTKLQHKAYYNAGTASVTPESTTVTLSVAPTAGSGSRANFFFAVDGFDEIYTISAHTAGSDTVTLSSQYNGSLNATAGYKIWTDSMALPTDCKETVEVWQDFHRDTMLACGLQEFRKMVRMSPKSASKPQWYHTYDYYDPTSGTDEYESDRYRVLKVHPSLISDTITLHVDYVKEAESLELDADEPLMPMEDRIVLVYGALSRAWARERNPEEAARNRMLFENKLARMAGKIEDGFDKPQITPNPTYVGKMRGARLGGRGSRRVFDGGGSSGSSYTSPTYITNATIGTGNQLTGNLTVSSGITIDGVDISVLATEVDALQALAAGQIFVGSLSGVTEAVSPSGDITLSSAGVFAIASGAILDGDINASAAITRSKLASGTADHVLINDGSGVMSSEATLSPVRGGTGVANNAAATLTRSGNHALTITTTGTTNVTLPTSGTLITGTGASTDNAVVRNDGTAGAIQTSGVLIDDSNNISGATSVAVTGGAYLNALVVGNSGGGAQSMTFNNGPSGPSFHLTDAAGYSGWDTTVQITSSHTAVSSLRIKGRASQTANYFESVNSSGTTLNYVSADGVIQADAGLGGKRATTATSYTALKTDVFVGVTDNSSARTITLPAANTMKAGQVLIIKDEAGTAASANNITVARAGSDTIDGATSVTITADYGVLRLYSNGSSAWFSF